MYTLDDIESNGSQGDIIHLCRSKPYITARSNELSIVELIKSAFVNHLYKHERLSNVDLTSVQRADVGSPLNQH